MRIQTRREQVDTERLIRMLREEISDLKAEVLEQGSANARLARRTATAEGCIAGARAAVAGPYRELKTRCERQEAEIKRLRARLDDALGRTPEQVAAIDAASGEPRKAITK